jgi:hypothetical protein
LVDPALRAVGTNGLEEFQERRAGHAVRASEFHHFEPGWIGSGGKLTAKSRRVASSSQLSAHA